MRRFFTLCIPLMAILTWWSIAFKTTTAQQISSEIIQHERAEWSLDDEKCNAVYHLLQLDRNRIRTALEGDISLMASLIHEWEIDAEVLDSLGHKNVKRLDRNLFLKSQLIARTLLNGQSDCSAAFQEKSLHTFVIDDMGIPVDLTASPQSFLPQTHLAAEILLSLTPAEKITALPEGFKELTPFISKERMDSISRIFYRHNSEWLYSCRPDIAFVSLCYSHPTAISIMKQHGIALFRIGEVSSIEAIKELIHKMGYITGSSLKAELMNIFIESALNTIDNKRCCLAPLLTEKRILVAFYHAQFSLPGKKSMTYKLLERIGATPNLDFDPLGGSEEEWSHPLREEQIHLYNPEHIAIIATASDSAAVYFSTLPALKGTDAVLKGRIAIVDEAPQKALSQYIVLAYYDLNNALVPLQ